MPFNGIGSFNSLGSPTFPAVSNTYILASYFNATMNDVFSGLSNALCKDGQSTPTADIAFGGYKLRNIANGILPTDAVSFQQVFTGGTFNNPTFTGVPAGPTAAPGTNTTQLATTAFVATQAFASALPVQTGQNGKFISTDGSTASWTALKTVNSNSLTGVGDIAVQATLVSGTNIKTLGGASLLGSGDLSAGLAVVISAGTTQACTAGNHYVNTNAAASTFTLPLTPASGDTVWVTFTNTSVANIIARNGQTIMGIAEDMTVNILNCTVCLRYVNSSWRVV